MPRKTKEQIEKLEETIKKVVPFGKKSRTKKVESETPKSELTKEEAVKDKKSITKKIESETPKSELTKENPIKDIKSKAPKSRSKLGSESIKKEPIKDKKGKTKKIESETSKLESIKEEPTKNKKSTNKDIESKSTKNKKAQTKAPKSKVKNLEIKSKLSDSLKLSENELNELKETINVIKETPVIKKAEENIKNLDNEFAKNIENDVKKTAKSLKIDENISEKTKKVEKDITKKIQALGKKQTLNKSKDNKNTSNKKESKFMTEYYDLPPKYNKTVVKLLAQTPKTLFIYWEISDEDIKKYKEQFGENFFETTRPVLIVHNDSLNYSFEVEINDFANSWYLHVNDSKSDYRIELGRRPIRKEGKLNTDYIYITSSNEIESPNDHILFDNSQKMIYFRNVKTNQVSGKSIANLTFIRNMGKIYNIYDLYQKMYAELYKDEGDIEKISNPSSHTSSQFK